MRKVTELLRDDHHKVQELFKQFEKTPDTDVRQNIVQEALKELMIHATVEEELIYPALEEFVDDEEKLEEAREEHHVARLLIAELWKMTPDSEHYDAKFKVLAESVKHHIKEEESELLPQLEDEDEDGMLGEQVIERKDELTAEIENEMTASMSSRRGARKSTRATQRADGREPATKARGKTTAKAAKPRISSRHSGARESARAGNNRTR